MITTIFSYYISYNAEYSELKAIVFFRSDDFGYDFLKSG